MKDKKIEYTFGFVFTVFATNLIVMMAICEILKYFMGMNGIFVALPIGVILGTQSRKVIEKIYFD